jgi:hypothetical protein
MATRSDERAQFLADVLEIALYHNGYGWFYITEYDTETHVATIEETEDGSTYTIDRDTVATGLGILTRAKFQETETPGVGRWTTEDGKPLGFGGRALTQLRDANRTNGLDGDIDVLGALAAIECALFGSVVYA